MRTALVGFLLLLCSLGIAASQEEVKRNKKLAVKKYVNTKEGLTGKLLEDYVDFTFEYPAVWNLVTDRKFDFVEVQRSVGTGKDEFTLEKFTVGHFSVSGNAEADKKLIPQLLTTLDNQFAAGFPNYKKTYEGPTKLGGYDGTELRFRSEFKHPKKNLIQIWGRAVLIPDPKGGRIGAAVIMLGTSGAPELKEEKDLGVKGELPTIIKSFKLGKQ